MATLLPPGGQRLMARLHHTSTIAGSQGEGHISPGSNSLVPSVTGQSHHHEAPLCQHSHTTPQACGDPKAQPTPSPEHRLPLALQQLRHLASKDRSLHQDPVANQAAPVPDTGQPPPTLPHITLHWLQTFLLLLQERAQGVWQLVKVSSKTKSCSAHPFHHVRQPCKARNVPLPGKYIPFKRHAIAVSRVQSTLGAGKQICTWGIQLFKQRSIKKHRQWARISQERAGEKTSCLMFSTQHSRMQWHMVNQPCRCTKGFKPPPRATSPSSSPRALIHAALPHTAGCH